MRPETKTCPGVVMIASSPASSCLNKIGRKSILPALLAGGALNLLSVGLALSQQQADPLAAVQSQSEARAKDLDGQMGLQQGPAILTDPVNRPDLPAAGGPLVELKTVNFEPPSAFLSDEELDAITGKYLRGRVDFRQIASVIRDVNDLYAKKGVVTAAGILPPQDLTDGSLEVRLVEGELGNVGIVGDHVTQNEFVLDRLRLTRNGNVIDVPTAARDIAYFNKTSRAQLRLLLQPGTSFGLTDLAVGITEPPQNHQELFINNEGASSTGVLQFGGSYRNYGPLGMDDNVMLFGTASRGSVSGTVSYDIPVTRSGTRVAASYTGSSIKVVNGPTAQLDIAGLSQAATTTVSQPLFASADWQLLVNGSMSKLFSSSKAGAVYLVDSDTSKGVLGLALTYSSEQGTFNVQPQLVYANVQDTLSNTTREIMVASGSARGMINLPMDMSVQVQAAAQYTDDVLVPGNLLFQVGGSSTVRGYPSDGVAGDQGYYGQIELHKNLESVVPGLDVFAFADVGEVFSTFPARTTLVSGGAGLVYNLDGRASFELTAAFPLRQAVNNQSLGAIYGRITASAF